jgi:hypothetical protein
VGRGFVLGEVLAEHLYKTRRVRDLPSGPQVILTTTDLGTGRALRIARDFIGSYDFSYVEPVPASITLGFAVAASAAVPVLFPPASLRAEGLGLRDAPPILSLADGGIYDNLGLEWFQGWRSGRPSSAIKPDFLIVANASGLLKRTVRAYGGLCSLWRSKDVQYSQTTKLRVRWFVGDLLGGRERGIYLGIELAPLAGLRTDLDRFLPQEADLLSYHAYWSTHARVTALYPELSVAAPAWREFADLQPTDTERLRCLLLKGAKRVRLPRWPT